MNRLPTKNDDLRQWNLEPLETEALEAANRRDRVLHVHAKRIDLALVMRFLWCCRTSEWLF
jgi:hypothetical protein